MGKKYRRCSVVNSAGEQCNSLTDGKLCSAHWKRKKKTGDVQADIPIKKMAPEGSGCVHPRDGYVIVTRNGKKGPEHRFLMEEILGRKLLPDENVHHKNGQRKDNRLENLELWSH